MKSPGRRPNTVPALALTGLLVIWLAAAAWASVPIVNSPALTIDPTDGVLTLPEAINQANSDGVPTTILFDPSVFPPAQPVTIFTQTRLYLQGAADTLDGTGAGVWFQPVTGAPDPGYALEISAANVTIRQFSFTGYQYGAIRTGTNVSGTTEDITTSGGQRGIFRDGASIAVRRAHVWI